MSQTMSQPDCAFDQILVKMKTSLHIVEEMEGILADISSRARRGMQREPLQIGSPALTGLKRRQ